MIIYEFSTWGDWKSENGLFSISEIEVEEKPKSYIGKRTRVLKDDIDKLSNSYGNRMYRLSNDPKPYITANIERMERNVESLESSLKIKKERLKKWEELLRKEAEKQ